MMVRELIWQPSPLLRRLLLLLVFPAVLIFFEFQVSEDWNSKVITNASMEIKDSRPTFPRHILLVSYYRTGSTFVGALLQSLQDSFYFFEPLSFMQPFVLNGNFDEARDMLAKLFTCRVSEVIGYLPWIQKRKHIFIMQKNILYWRECRKRGTCYSNNYFEDFCRSKMTIVVKTARLNLLEASRLLETHPELNLKIIHLVRDPRGTMNSRQDGIVQEWCKNDTICFNSTIFCSRVSEDLNTVCRLLADRPRDFLVVRYEDLCTDAEGESRRLVEFLGMSAIPQQTKAFLKTHTYVLGNPKNLETDGIPEPYTTFRNSSATVFKWRKEMGFKNVSELQKVCRTVLKAYGYRSFNTASELVNNTDTNNVAENSLEDYCHSENVKI